jgi:hypothetical protein
VRVWGTAGDRKRLAPIVRNRNSPQKHVWRARIVSAHGEWLWHSAEIMRLTGKSKSVVCIGRNDSCRRSWRGLLRDKTRASPKPPLATAVISQVIDLTATAPPGRATHWTAPAMAKTVGIVGLYVDPPDHAVVLSITRPGVPMKKGRAGTMTHDYKRHGTTSLFAALNILEGKVTCCCMAHHRHQEFIRFVDSIEAQVEAKGHPRRRRQLCNP